MAFKNIAIAIDGSKTSDIALVKAIYLAKKIKATLNIIHVIDAFVYYDLASGQNYSNFVAAKQRLGHEILAKAAKKVAKYDLAFKAQLIENVTDPKKISEKIVSAIEHLSAEILIMGTQGHRGLKGFFLGSVAGETIRISSVPVLLIGPEANKIKEYKNIICAVDGSKHSQEALLIAINLSKSLAAKLKIIHVVHELPFRLPLGFHLVAEENYLRTQGKHILETMNVIAQEQEIVCRKKLIEIKNQFQTISQALLEEILKHKSTLIVMGTHGLRGVNRFLLGSVASEIVHTSPVPVLIVGSKCKYHANDRT